MTAKLHPSHDADEAASPPVFQSSAALGFDVLMPAKGSYCVRWHGKPRWSECFKSATEAVLCGLKGYERGVNHYLLDYYDNATARGTYTGD